jgi:ABC-type uncharacterized transport system involved in gliding motility auxiliary subunit
MRTGRKVIVVVLLLVALVLVNYLASSLPWRGDLTAERIYTLSPGTRALLSKIGDPITLDLYFSKNTGGQFVEFVNYADRVQEMLRQYVRASHGKLILNVIDPQPDTPQEEKATAAGIQPQTLPQGGDQFYFGLVATAADQQKAIPVLTPDREQFLEHDLSELIYSVQQANKKKLGLLTSLPLQGTPAMPGATDQPQPAQYVVTEWQDTFDIVPVDASATSLPAGLDALAIVHPENVTPQLQFSIDQFLLSGKPVFLAVDPSSLYFRAQGGQAAMFNGPPPNVSSDLPTLLGGWGIAYDPSKVVADPDDATEVQNSQTGATARYPDWLSLTADNFNQQALPMAELSRINFMDAGSVSLKPGTGLAFVPLAQTSDHAGEVDGMAIQFSSPDDIARQLKPSDRLTIAALVSGRFHTAFPGGRPPEAPPTDGSKPPPAPADTTPALKESRTTSNLIVVADSDWLLDDYSVRKVNFLGQTAAEPLNDNLSFAANSLDFLSGSQDLISIRGKGNSIRPFTVVQKMEAAASAKYEEKLTELENELNDVQSKLSDLQGKSNQGNRLVANPEVAKAIEDFQKQEASLQGQRREIRLALRQGIDALENRLLAINLLATPLLVCGFGLWFYRSRRK